MDKKNKYLLAAVILLLIIESGIGFTTIVARDSGKKAASGQKENELIPWEMPVVDAPNVLPGRVNAVVEDSTGTIWIGTDNGLVRVDPKNNSWRIFSTSDGLASNIIDSIHVARDGKIWFGFWSAKGVTCYDPSAHIWRTLPTSNNKYISTHRIFEEQSGALWFYGYYADIYRWTPGGTKLVYKDDNYPEWENQIFRDKRGFEWIGGSFLKRYNPENKTWQTLSHNDIYTIFEDSRGIIWFGGPNGVSRYDYEEEKNEKFELIFNKIDGTVHEIDEDWNGNIWLVTTNGIFNNKEKSDNWVKVFPNGAYTLDVDSIFMGNNRDMWFGCSGGYLRYISETNEWKSYMLQDDLPSIFPLFKFFKSDGKKLAFSNNSLFFQKENEDLWESTPIMGFPGNIPEVKVDMQGRLLIKPLLYPYWEKEVSSFLGCGVHQFEFAQGFWHEVPDDFLFLRSTKSVINYGSVWSYIFEGSWGASYYSFIWPIFKDVDVNVVHVDQQNRIWIAAENGLHRCDWNTGECQKISLENVEEFGSIYSISENADGSLWFGTQKAAILYDPNSKSTTTVMLPQNIKDPVNASLQDRYGRLWLAAGSGILRYSHKNEKWKLDETVENIKNITEIREYDEGMLWFLGEGDNLYRYNPRTNKWKNLNLQTLGANPVITTQNNITFPDSTGGIWFPTHDSLTRQTWNNQGVPGRQETFPFNGRENYLGQISYRNETSMVLWRTRRTGLLKVTDRNAEAYAADTGFPINVLEKAPNGGVWVGYTMGGLDFRRVDGKLQRFKTADGLPHMTILDISQVPGVNKEALAWVGTNNGAALVNREKVLLTVKPEPGPVDVVLALSDASVYMAFNRIPESLFLNPISPFPRQVTSIKYLSAKGDIISEVVVPGVDVLDMALDRNGKTSWVGTTSGLYCIEDNIFKRIPVTGLLMSFPVSIVTVDPEGTVWMGIDGQNGNQAYVVGYRPQINNMRIFTPDIGLSTASSIGMIDYTSEGRLVVLAGDRLVSGRVFVPSKFPMLYALIILLLVAVIAAGSVIVVSNLKQRRTERDQYKPLMNSAREFFLPVSTKIKQVNYRTLKIFSKGKTILIRGALGDMIPVEEIQGAFTALNKSFEIQSSQSYLVYPNELNPAALRQLDVYRLHHNAIIVPLSLTFIRAKLAAGIDATREAMDGLLRRYLGNQDLFDMRNAIEEPRFFFGRRALIDELFNALNRREHVAVIGPRKAGKSSLLNLLSQKLNTFPVVMIDLQLFNREDSNWPDQLLNQIIDHYDSWGRSRFGKKWNPQAFSDNQISGPVFREALAIRRELQQRLKNDQPLVVMLDEMERLFPKTGLKHGKAEHAERFSRAAGILRALGQEGGERLLSLVIADRQPMFNRINNFKIPGVETNPFYRFFQEYNLKPLDKSECEEMLREIAHAMGLELEAEVMETIFSDSGGYPALARQLASAACSQRKDSSKIEMMHYQQGLKWLHEERGDIDQFFKENFWYPLNNPERLVLALAAAENGVSRETLETTGKIPFLEGDSIPGDEVLPVRSKLVEARQNMLANGILERYNGGYRVSGSLFRSWLQKNTR